MIVEKRGNIFTSDLQTIVNTVNCDGFMGAGIAYEFRLRYPEMFHAYKTLCKTKQMKIGKLWLYKAHNRSILNFPTKLSWKLPTRPEYLQAGLEKFVNTYEQKGITSIAFPLLGASNGGLSIEYSLSIMQEYLRPCPITIEIWHYDPHAKDELFNQLCKLFNNNTFAHLKLQTGISSTYLSIIKESLNNQEVRTINQLIHTKGLGDKTLEKLFAYLQCPTKEMSLFDF